MGKKGVLTCSFCGKKLDSLYINAWECDHCKKIFCNDHEHWENHNCKKDGNKIGESEKRTRLKYKPANFGKRVVAHFVDGGVNFSIIFLFSYLSLYFDLVGLIYIDAVIIIIYFLIRDGIFGDGKSIGKRLLGIKVVDYNNGKPCTIKQSIIRNIAWYIPFFQIIEPIKILTDQQNRRFGDEFANTVVIENRKK